MENGQLRIDQLTINQLRWLAERAWHETDQECLKALGLGASTVSRWRAEQPAFVEAEKSIYVGDLKRTQEIIARLRDKAALTLEKLLATRDPRTRRATAVDLLKFGGMVQGEAVALDLSPALASLLAEAGEAAGGEEGGGDE